MAADGVDHLMNKRYQEAFDLVKSVFNVNELYDEQIKLIKAFCGGQNIYILVHLRVMENPLYSSRCRGFAI